MTAGGQEHWNSVYGARAEDELSWFEATPSLSRELVLKYLEPGDAFKGNRQSFQYSVFKKLTRDA